MDRIEKLTPHQEAMLPVWRDKFTAIGLKTGPIDRGLVRSIVDDMYTCGGLKPPEHILILGGPKHGMIAANLIEGGSHLPSVKECQSATSKPKVIWPATYGQHDVGWLSLYSFFEQQCGIAMPKMKGLFRQLELGWCWLYPDVAVVTERPTTLRLDEVGRLHSADGPALLYPDGFSAWCWHGVRVPSQVISSPHTLTVEQIKGEANAEVRRIMVERYGQAKYIRDAGATVLAMDEIGILYNLPQAGDEDIKMIRVLNSTPEPDGTRKEYMLRVPPNMRSPKEAVAWTFGLKESDYSPERES